VRGCLVDVPKALQESPLAGDCSTKFYSSNCNSISSQMRNATRSVGRSHSSNEVFVMKMERRASVIQSNYFETTLKEDDGKRNDKVIAY